MPRCFSWPNVLQNHYYFPFSMCLLFYFSGSSLILSCHFDFLCPLTLPSISITSFVSYLYCLSTHLQLSKFLDLICGPFFLSIPPHKALPLNVCPQNNISRPEAIKLNKKDEGTERNWKGRWTKIIEKPQILNKQCYAAILPLLHPAWSQNSLVHCSWALPFLPERKKNHSFRFFKCTPAALLSSIALAY